MLKVVRSDRSDPGVGFCSLPFRIAARALAASNGCACTTIQSGLGATRARLGISNENRRHVVSVNQLELRQSLQPVAKRYAGREQNEICLV